LPSKFRYFTSNRIGFLLVEIDNAHGCAVLGKFQCDCPSNAAARARNDGNFAIEAELVCVALFCDQRETPRFQGIKSC
jgi:hypothetical protein